MKSLLVEDNPADARAICEMLWEAPAGTFELQQANRLEAALGWLRREKFDVLLVDLGLPDSQGMETLTRLQQAAGDPPLLVLTGLQDQAFAVESVRAGAADYLVKGHFDADALIRSIHYAVERKKIELTLKRERQRLFDVLEAMPVMLCLLTPDYAVAFANRAFREQFGEANGRPCYEYCFGRSDPCEFCESFEPLKTGKPHRWQTQTANGRLIDVYSQPFIDSNGSRLILELDTDITDERRARDELTRSHADLLRFNQLATGREVRMTELKQKINELSIRLGESPPYATDLLHADFSDQAAPSASRPPAPSIEAQNKNL